MLNSKKLIISMIEQLNMGKTCQLLYLLIGLLMLINIENWECRMSNKFGYKEFIKNVLCGIV